MGWEEGLVAIKCIFMVWGQFFIPKKSNRQMHCWGGVRHSSRHRWYGTKPRAGIIAHGVGVTPMRLLVASSDHRRWYGPKPPAVMVGGKHDVSDETEVVMRGQKYRSVRYIFYVTLSEGNLRFRTHIKLVVPEN